MEYREQIFVLTAAFANAASYERDGSYCNIMITADDRILEALEKLKKDTRAGVVSVSAENGVIEARFDLGFLSMNEPQLADLLRERSAPKKIPASERPRRQAFVPFIVK